MILQNNKYPYGTYRGYTLIGRKKVYYYTPNDRLPHQGRKEQLRRIRQKIKSAIKNKNRKEMMENMAKYGDVL